MKISDPLIRLFGVDWTHGDGSMAKKHTHHLVVILDNAENSEKVMSFGSNGNRIAPKNGGAASN